jgi:hypothetical protein
MSRLQGTDENSEKEVIGLTCAMLALPVALPTNEETNNVGRVVVHALHGDLFTPKHRHQGLLQRRSDEATHVTTFKGPSGEDKGEVFTRKAADDVVSGFTS